MSQMCSRVLIHALVPYWRQWSVAFQETAVLNIASCYTAKLGAAWTRTLDLLSFVATTSILTILYPASKFDRTRLFYRLEIAH